MPTCTRCGGKGLVKCPACDGRGVVEEGQLELIAAPSRAGTACPECRGAGTLSCPVCDATGVEDNED